MPTSTRLLAAAIALTSMLAMVSAGRVAHLERDMGAARPDAPELSVTRVRTAIRTDWLNPADARSSLEARTAALAEWLHARGGSVQVISSTSLLRTHEPEGARLTTPEARFERIVEIELPDSIAFEPSDADAF
jgi:hypothetical protein